MLYVFKRKTTLYKTDKENVFSYKHYRTEVVILIASISFVIDKT